MPQSLERQLGGLYASGNPEPIALPLQHTEVEAKVAGNISRVEVTQRFQNPFTTTIEAIYVFPLPDEAAVDDLVIRIGDRTIQGSIKKRQEAQQIYDQAKRQGRTAGLLEQERDNIFTQSLANIQPGESIEVTIRYTDSLKFEGGNYEFVFPMVVGPRYIPGTPIGALAIADSATTGSAPAPMTRNQDTDLVPDASRLNAPILPAGVRSGHDINVTVEIETGLGIREIQSPSHQIQIAQMGQQVRVNLAKGDTIANKDLILRYQVAGETTQTTVLTQADDRGGHFALYLIPAIAYRPDQVVPKDVVFLIDTSGSQMGAPLMQCQELMRRMVDGLNPDDSFSIIDFSDTTQQLSPVPLPNTAQNRSRALRYISQLTASGGTNMLRGIQAILNFPVTDRGRLRSIVLLTDGYIGNENQILAEVQRHLQPGNRLHSFGAGSSVNRFLLNRVAELGRGISRIIRHDEPTETVVEQFFRQINNPVLANLHLQWEGGGESPEIYPSALPDLFAEQPLVLFGRKPDRQSGKLHLTGVAAGGTRYQQTFDLNFADLGNPAIAQLWGRSRIKHLTNQMVGGDTKVGVEAVTETALNYQLLSQYTAFVAVSDEVRVDAEPGSVSVQVPVEMPDGIRYEGIYGSAASLTYGSQDGRMEGGDILAGAPATVRVRAGRSRLPGAPARGTLVGRAKRETQETEQESGFADLEGFAEFDQLTQLEEFGYSLGEVRAGSSPSPSSPSRKSEGMKSATRGDSSLQIISATGLDQDAIELLWQHLQSLQLPPVFSGGDLVFEFQVNQGRVRQSVWDEQASSFTEAKVVEAIRRSLLSWKPPQTLTHTVLLILRFQP